VDLISDQFSLYHNPTSLIHINLLIYSEDLKGVCSFAVLRPIKAVNIGVYKRVVYQAKYMILLQEERTKGLGNILNIILGHTMLGGVPVPTAWLVLVLRMEERPPAMEVSWEYIE
jgi:hypothetical protein